MTIYAVSKAYGKNNSIRYDVLPYNLQGTIKCYFSRDIRWGLGNGYALFDRIKYFLQFISMCRISEKSANKLAEKYYKLLY